MFGRLCVVLLLLLPVVAAQPQVEVPAQVWGGQVAFRVSEFGANATAVNVTIEAEPEIWQRESIDAAGVVFMVLDAPVGEYAWRVEVENATAVNHTITGTILVEDVVSELAALRADLSGLNSTVASQEAGTELPDNLTVDLSSVLSRLAAMETTLLAAGEEDPELHSTPSIQAPQASSSVGTIVTSVLIVAVLVLVGVLQYQAYRRHQEQMVLVLAMAARMNVGPDSPEFQTALAALEG